MPRLVLVCRSYRDCRSRPWSSRSSYICDPSRPYYSNRAAQQTSIKSIDAVRRGPRTSVRLVAWANGSKTASSTWTDALHTTGSTIITGSSWPIMPSDRPFPSIPIGGSSSNMTAISLLLSSKPCPNPAVLPIGSSAALPP